ncbi:hypothetical protein BP5796_12060 [Coleophoma crateriformis]|uniref:Bacteriocin-protection protein n=1 Tax=Coleophoma crateriformis TaxID=565419 RepID=A0A3D8QBB4_9HELO|nr:hypothetical protein BP5796_12060 [Coleophoma crateriformis]
MSTKAKTAPTYSFSTTSEFETFLEREHQTADGFLLKLAKKASGIPSITAAQAVEVALCFGWIDGQANKVDDAWWSVRYTPRRAKSIWSQKNVETVARLGEQGRMRPAGLAVVEAAKADGRWERAYAGPATIVVPEDLAAALAVDAAAAAFFEAMNKSDRYAVLWRVETASPPSRAKRIAALVQTLAAGKRPGAAVKPVEKAQKTAGVQKASAKPAGVEKVPAKRKLDGVVPVQNEEVIPSRREGLRRRL